MVPAKDPVGKVVPLPRRPDTRSPSRAHGYVLAMDRLVGNREGDNPTCWQYGLSSLTAAEPFDNALNGEKEILPLRPTHR